MPRGLIGVQCAKAVVLNGAFYYALRHMRWQNMKHPRAGTFSSRSVHKQGIKLLYRPVTARGNPLKWETGQWIR